MTRIPLVFAGLLVAAAIVPLAFGAATAQTVIAKETNFKITLSAKPRAGTVRFVARNASPIVHDLWVRGGGRTFRTKLIKPGKSALLVTTLKRGVRYRIWCNVDAHAKLGMNRFFVAR